MTTLSERVVERAAGRPGLSRRGFLGSAALVGAALAVNPWSYLTRPASAYDAVCGADNTCAAGYSVFCCTINSGQNTCPPQSFVGGWWKADNSSFCGGSARYYVDCNAYRDGYYQCHCNTTTCDQRLVACNQFRYGQCNTQIPYSSTGPVVCRMVSCTPPWQQFGAACSTTSATDNNTATHSAPCNDGAVPVGIVESVTATGNTVRLTGWTFDPDQPSTSIQVAVYSDGAGLAAFTASVPRADVQAQYGIGGDHGFDISVSSPSGDHTFDVYGLNVGPGSNVRIGGSRITVNPGASPVGALDSATSTANQVRLVGWAVDADQLGTALQVDVYVDGAGAGRYTAGVARPDVTAATGAPGGHGFDIGLDVPNGPHTVAVYGISVGGGNNQLLGLRTLEVNPGAAPVGALDAAVVAGGTVRLTGWAYDPDVPADAIDVAVYSDGTGVAWYPTGVPRPDVQAARGITGDHGYDLRLTLPEGVHTLAVYGLNRLGGVGNPLLGVRTVGVGAPGPIGTVDTVSVMGATVRLTGWAFDPGAPATQIQVAVYLDGTGVAWFPTGVPRPDVQAGYGVDGDHGYDLTVTAAPGTRAVSVYAISASGNRLVGTRTVTV